ncbi:hypothetical protein C8F04DRAFT_1189848 [Mycena alexandri]|uniref:Uncharacterized protein n=1 Tax=Mycena alexandri TaxID=1745969 RepID=A0AAD6SFV3_9AGAR|nr:hypothetical protein C8F04DRAFT_1189845 [Mycena alexandri]KAJ7027185.1 hypothetical protein C8F04DRAFT_1189848 [Mycena alexandri]
MSQHSSGKWEVPANGMSHLFGLRSENQKGYIGTICGPFWLGIGSFESLSGGRSVGMRDQLDENCSSGGIRAPIGLGVGPLDPHTSGLPLGTILGVSECFHFPPNFGTQHRNRSSGGIRAPIGLGVGPLDPHTSGLPLGTILGVSECFHFPPNFGTQHRNRSSGGIRAPIGLGVGPLDPHTSGLPLGTILGVSECFHFPPNFGTQHRNRSSGGIRAPIGLGVGPLEPHTSGLPLGLISGGRTPTDWAGGGFIKVVYLRATAGYLIKGI